MEWNEAALHRTNSDLSAQRVFRGGAENFDGNQLRSSNLEIELPENELPNLGFRVASVPEPSTYALIFMAGAGWLVWSRWKHSL